MAQQRAGGSGGGGGDDDDDDDDDDANDDADDDSDLLTCNKVHLYTGDTLLIGGCGRCEAPWW